MRSVKAILAAAAATFMTSAAFAADLPAIAPPPYYAPPVEDFGGWYLRGDIGFSNQNVKSLFNAQYDTINTLNQRTGFDTAGIFGVGVGYQFNNWLRGDVTGEYRGKSNFHGLDLVSFNNSGTTGYGADVYSASKSEWLFLANAYADLGTWYCITPFVGVGIGAARNTISNFVDQGVSYLDPSIGGVGPSIAYGDSASKWNLAWALHAGLAYRVNHNLTLELSYRYVNLGSAASGDLRPFDGPGVRVNPMEFHDITSQDLRFGVRWQLDAAPTYAPPLIRKG